MNRFSLVLSLSLLAGCGGTAAPEEDVEACEHLKEGPGVSVTAAKDASTALPTVNEPHKRHDISLVVESNGGARGGLVSYASTAEGDYALYLSVDVPVEVTDSAGNAVAFESTTGSVSSCSEVKSKRVLELGVGTYTFRFGPTPQPSVAPVVESAEHAH